jgi:hypothetical protein
MGLHFEVKDKMAGPREENGSWGNAKKNHGRKTVYRKKERNASFEMDGRCSSRFESKGKAIPLQALTGPEGSRRLRLPDFKTIDG